MNQYLRTAVRAMAGYTPGEQPRDGAFIKLNTNENPYPPSPRVFEALRDALTGDRLRKYPDPTGAHFRNIAGRVLNVDPDGILIGNGSDDVLTIVTRAFVPEGGLVVVADAELPAVPHPRRASGRPLGDGAVHGGLEASGPVAKRRRQPHLRRQPELSLRHAVSTAGLAGLSAGLNGPLVVDEAYVDFAEENALELVRSDKNVIVTRTLSKSYSLAGIRFGFLIADPALVRELIKVKDSYNCDVLSQVAAAAALEDQDYLRTTRAQIIATRGRLERELTRLGFAVTPSQANFVWCRHADRPAKTIYEELRRRRILVRYMNYGDYGDGLRVSVGSDAEVGRLIEVLTQLS